MPSGFAAVSQIEPMLITDWLTDASDVNVWVTGKPPLVHTAVWRGQDHSAQTCPGQLARDQMTL